MKGFTTAIEGNFVDHQPNEKILLEQFESLTNSGTWEYNLDTDTTQWSDGVFRMLGYESQEFEVNFDTAVAIIHEDDRDEAIFHMQEVISQNQEYNIKKRLIKKDGEIIWVNSKGKLISEEKSGQKKLIGVFQNITEYVQTKEKLKTVKKKNRSLIENLDGIFWEADANTFEFTYVSPQVKRITGYSSKEWLATKDFWKNHIYPADRQDSIQTCHNETQKLKDHTIDYRFLAKDGKIIWFNDRVKVISRKGKPYKLQGLMVEITKEKQISQALKDEINLNQSLIQKLPSVFFLFNTEGKLLLWNHQLEKESEYSSDEITKMSPESFFAGEDHLTIKYHIKKVIDEGATDLELEILSKTGKKTPFFFSVSRFFYQDEICIFGTGQNISELVESRKSTAQHIERYQIVTQATSDAIWDYDRKKNSLYWGEGFLSLFGYNPSKIEPSFEFLLSLIHPDDRNRVFRLIQLYIDPKSTKKNWLEEYRFLKSDGTYAIVLDKAIFIRDDSGNVSRVVGAMQDITRQKDFELSLKELNQQLEKNVRDLALSNLELQQFAFVASHDLQEPLRMISSFLGLLERRYKSMLDDKALEYIGFAANGANQMKKIILDLLELSRVGKVDGKKEKLDLGALIEEIKMYLRKPIQSKNAVITFENLPIISTYKTPVLQIFQNLIVNGLKYSKADVSPQITIRSRDIGQYWEFTVADNGIGIDPEYFNKIFVVFQRLHGKKDFDGSGIGLSIVKKSVEFLEGEITVESQVGVGTEFTFTIKK
ncbi:MAG: PAS domain-containing protein [Algoriphagus sp.]|uniref:PAS domain-containing protein n=1 Tax=Algoriphagus sp. TaxID=1872435 RepID=UPI0027308FEC|nr:PAS domain-containing protein [Algoriphagus sp.]MDP2043136.1 PAS domain-containing protein [Algoriphagus sp.]MDP3474114.1 PAS domain-containing protein [Algoriphagus sp.]